MSEIVIRPFNESDLIEVREIFFESSTRKVFKDQNEKDQFEFKYLGYYLKYYPLLCFVACQGNQILGYIVGSPDSSHAELRRLQPHLKSFEDYFSQYPAHIHINCHADSRGKGVGSLLMRRIIFAFEQESVMGLHIMTGSDSSNREFYRKLGFDFEALGDFQGNPILIMGKKLRV